jgi:hypothetical protein
LVLKRALGVLAAAAVVSKGMVAMVASCVTVSSADAIGVVFVIVTGFPTVTSTLEPIP